MTKCFYKKVKDFSTMTGEQIAKELTTLVGADTSEEEQRSWSASIPELVKQIKRAGLSDLYLVLEYHLLDGGRVDAILTGYSVKKEPAALLIELKQWSARSIEICRDPILCFKVKGNRPYLTSHPVIQVNNYVYDLRKHHSEVVNGKLHILPCVYLFNFPKGHKSLLFQEDGFSKLDQSFTFFKQDNGERTFVDFLKSEFMNTDDQNPLELLLNGKPVMDDLDMESFNKISENSDSISLFSEQQKIMSAIKPLLVNLVKNKLHGNYMILVSGGAGTGKTILGFHILSEYWNLKNEQNAAKTEYSCAYAVPRSRTIFQVLKGITEENKNSVQLSYLDRLQGPLDLLILDEAHRAETKNLFPDRNDTDIALSQTRISIILQDDKQRVLGTEAGTIENYKIFAYRNSMKFRSFKLNYSIRNGFGGYVQAIDELLYGTGPSKRNPIGLEIRYFNSIQKMENEVKEIHKTNHSIKYFAPFCWDWESYKPDKENYQDIVIKDNGYIFSKQWNPKYDQYEWYKDSISRVGCVYTAQGLGFDYVALIWWDDLKWNKAKKKWVVNMSSVTKHDRFLNKSLDKSKNYDYLIFNIYRILLTRAKKGILLWFRDKETREHFENVMSLYDK